MSAPFPDPPRLRPVVVVALVAALVAFTLAGVVSAFTLVSPQRTASDPLQYVVDDRGMTGVADVDGGVTAVVDALNAPEGWNGGGVGTIVEAAGGSVASFSLGDGVPMVNFRDPLNICTGSCLQVTLTGFYSARSDGSFQIDDLDVVFNSSQPWTSEGEDPNGFGCSGEFYLESQAVFALGRGLGFGNSTVVGATMYPSVATCDNSKASIEADDAAGLVALYGAAPCTDCLRYERVLGAGGAAVTPGSFYTTTAAGVQRGWLEGTAGTDYDLELWQDLGSGYLLVATSATGGSSSEAITFPGAAADYVWVVRSNGASGRYFFYLRASE